MDSVGTVSLYVCVHLFWLLDTSSMLPLSSLTTDKRNNYFLWPARTTTYSLTIADCDSRYISAVGPSFLQSWLPHHSDYPWPYSPSTSSWLWTLPFTRHSGIRLDYLNIRTEFLKFRPCGTWRRQILLTFFLFVFFIHEQRLTAITSLLCRWLSK